MHLDVLQFTYAPTKTRVGQLLIKYGDLNMKCELVYYPKGKKAWVRMPELWVDTSNKISYAYWPNKENSEAFQQEILRILEGSFGLSGKKIQRLHCQAASTRGMAKNSGQDLKEELL